MQIVLLENIVAGLKATGQIFGAEYIKKDGSVTKINGRFGVHKFINGRGKSSPKVLTVWDNNRKRYTSLIPEQIVSIQAYKSKFIKHPYNTNDGVFIDTSR